MAVSQGLASVPLESCSASEVLEWAIYSFGNSFAISTSFQNEGMVIIDMAARISPGVRAFTLDTGRLPDETYQMVEAVRERYGICVEMVSPDAAEIESMTAQHGPNLFYREPALRMLCCQIRKVRPLERKLKELKAWAVGLRRGQNEERAEIPKIDTGGGMVKISPLAHWHKQQVEDYIHQHAVPVHPLYAKGYTSIGCAPCTRPVQLGEEERTGRWWWEQDASKECGIHFTPSGKAERKLDVLLSEVLAAKHV